MRRSPRGRRVGPWTGQEQKGCRERGGLGCLAEHRTKCQQASSGIMRNPFPGMNPWLDEYWRDVHVSFLVYASDLLNREIPEGMQARVDERTAFEAEREESLLRGE